MGDRLGILGAVGFFFYSFWGVDQRLGVNQRLGVTPMHWKTSFLYFLFNFLCFFPVFDGKRCCNAENVISTSERCVKHPFNGKNTQHMSSSPCKNSCWALSILSNSISQQNFLNLNRKLHNFDFVFNATFFLVASQKLALSHIKEKRKCIDRVPSFYY